MQTPQLLGVMNAKTQVAFIALPQDWSPQQITEFAEWFTDLVKDDIEVHFLPSGTTVQIDEKDSQ